MTPLAAPSVPDNAAGPSSPGIHPGNRNGQAFWTLVVGLPALLSVLRLWIEAGGDLQTTLLLVANVAPINLMAALVVTTTWLVTTGLVAVFAVGGVLLAAKPSSRPKAWSRPMLFARWAAAAPKWMKAGAFLFAALTWQILYLPLLLLAACAAFQLSTYRGRGKLAGTGYTVLALAGYALLFGPTIREAVAASQWLVVLLLVAPPLLALGISGVIVDKAVKPFGFIAQAAVVAFLIWSVHPSLTTPVLPRTVTVVKSDTGQADYIRGYVVDVNDLHTTVLQEDGGVRFVDNDDVESQELCAGEEELPRYALWVHSYYVEDSILRGVGRQFRPTAPTSPTCLVPAAHDPVAG